MIAMVVHVLVTAALLFAVGRLVNGIEVEDGGAAIFGALGLGLANAFVRPILLFLTLPVTLLTFGLFIWVVNAIVLMLVANFVSGFEVKGFKPAIVGSILFAALNFGVGFFFGI